MIPPSPLPLRFQLLGWVRSLDQFSHLERAASPKDRFHTKLESWETLTSLRDILLESVDVCWKTPKASKVSTCHFWQLAFVLSSAATKTCSCHGARDGGKKAGATGTKAAATNSHMYPNGPWVRGFNFGWKQPAWAEIPIPNKHPTARRLGSLGSQLCNGTILYHLIIL